MKKACVTGWPIGHSRSPIIHEFWLKKYKISGSYGVEAVRPEDFPAFINKIRDGEYVGANVTIPHKLAALKACDVASETARKIGAANTLWLEGDKLHADNTDAYGFISYLDEVASGWNDDAPAAVLGAGGAARAVVYALVERDIQEVRIFNRTLEKAKVIANEYGSRVTTYDWSLRSENLAECGLLVNTTSLGMAGSPPLEMDIGVMGDNSVVFDIVYTPLKTDLLRQAEMQGLNIVDGLGMLMHQAVPGFERWFGKRPAVTKELHDLLINDVMKVEKC
jgi:shikimate dehydrogenase